MAREKSFPERGKPVDHLRSSRKSWGEVVKVGTLGSGIDLTRGFRPADVDGVMGGEESPLE